MTRADHISHLDTMRKAVIEIINYHYKTIGDNGKLAKPTELEEERAKKTEKMLHDLETRLYEDGAISERVKTEKMLAGDTEQAEFSFEK